MANKVTPAEIEQRLNNNEEVNIIDVREYAEVMTGKFPVPNIFPWENLL